MKGAGRQRKDTTMRMRIGFGLALLFASFLGGMAGSWILSPATPSASVVDASRGGIVATFGVGGVLTSKGELWQWRPDKGAWVSLDESFALEGQATSVVPLPVPLAKIRIMETFGFLVTNENDCWLYNIDNHVWENVGKPKL
jgi:hypothetical protein